MRNSSRLCFILEVLSVSRTENLTSKSSCVSSPELSVQHLLSSLLESPPNPFQANLPIDLGPDELCVSETIPSSHRWTMWLQPCSSTSLVHIFIVGRTTYCVVCLLPLLPTIPSPHTGLLLAPWKQLIISLVHISIITSRGGTYNIKYSKKFNEKIWMNCPYALLYKWLPKSISFKIFSQLILFISQLANSYLHFSYNNCLSTWIIKLTL